MSRQFTRDFFLMVAQGLIPGHTAVSILGINPTIGATVFEDLWDVGGVLTYPTATEQWELVSDSAQDGSGGTGALTVLVVYLDDSYVEQTETITTNGTTPVTFVATDSFRFIRAFVLSSGTDMKNNGTITVRVSGQTTQAFLRGRISAPVTGAGGGSSFDGHHTVPAGFTDWLCAVYSNANKGEDIDVRLEGTVGISGSFSQIFITNLYQSSVVSPVKLAPGFTEKSDLKLLAKSSNPNAVGSVALQFVRTDNSIVVPV